MRIAVVKTCDGPMYYSLARNAGKYAAVRMAIQQLEGFGESVFGMDSEAESKEIACKLKNAGGDSYKLAVAEGFIQECNVIDG